MKLNPETELEKHVAAWFEETMQDGGYDSIGGVAEDLWQGGCASGVVCHLIYYKDTLAFYQEHQADINVLLRDLIDGTGESVGSLLRDWDESDPLALDTSNQNLLAWFGFEEAARRLLDRAEGE